MRTLAITQNVSLDGSVEFLTGWFNPAQQGEQTSQLDVLLEQFARSDALVLGRRTFEDFRGYWPLQDDDTTGISSYLGGVHKYVVSSTLVDPAWENTTVLTGDPVAEIAELKARPGRDIVVEGSISLCHTLVAAGLVDEFRLFTYRPSRAGAGACSPTATRPGPSGWPRRRPSPTASSTPATSSRVAADECQRGPSGSSATWAARRAA